MIVILTICIILLNLFALKWYRISNKLFMILYNINLVLLVANIIILFIISRFVFGFFLLPIGYMFYKYAKSINM